MTTTWAAVSGRPRSVTATCTTGTESAPSIPAKATGTATLVSVAAGDTLTLAGVTFTASASDGTGQNFLQTGTDTVDAAALAAAINRYQQQTHCSATSATNVVTITALDYGTEGNALTLTETGTTITVSGATLTGGVALFGVNLNDVAAVNLVVRAASGQTVAAGTYKAYFWDPDSGVVASVSEYDIAGNAAALRSYMLVGLSAGIGVPILGSRGYLGWVPSGVTISSGSAVIDHLCTSADGRAI